MKYHFTVCTVNEYRAVIEAESLEEAQNLLDDISYKDMELLSEDAFLQTFLEEIVP